MTLLVHLCACGHPVDWHAVTDGPARPCSTRGCACTAQDPQHDRVRVVTSFDPRTLAPHPLIEPGAVHGMGSVVLVGAGRGTSCDCDTCWTAYRDLTGVPA